MARPKHVKKSTPSLSLEEWHSHALKNALHKAEIFIASDNAQKVAESLADIEHLLALEHLFVLANKYRTNKNYKKALTAIEASEHLRAMKK